MQQAKAEPIGVQALPSNDSQEPEQALTHFQVPQHEGPVLEHALPQLSVPLVVVSQAGTAAVQEPSGTQAQAGPVLEQAPPQLSTPFVVVSHAGAGAEHEPSGTQLQAGPVLEQALPQLSVPLVVAPQSGSAAEQEVTAHPAHGQAAAASTAARNSVV